MRMTESQPEKKIIVIPAKKESPQEQAKKRNLRVAAYCRVSTGDEEQLTSYENQKAFYTEKIMKNPEWTMVDIFADEGITGTSTCRRKDFLRMIRQCRQGKIDMILAKSVSRFARNTLDTISYTRELRSLGIAVIFEEQNINSIYPESEFLIALHAAFAQSESESISANVTWGKRRAMESGKATIQYKYLYGFRRGADDKPEIIPEEAEVVRWIYERYLAGASTRMLRDELHEQGVIYSEKSPQWTLPHIKSILRNEKYCHSSPTLDEAPLQQAIIAALNTVLPDLDGRIRQITEALEAEVIPFPGSGMSLGDIDRRLTELEAQFQRLLEKAADDPIAYGDQFKEILDEQTALKELRATILAENKKHAEADRRIRDAAGMLENAVPHIAEWDESAIRQLVAQVKVLSKNEISVTLKSGIEIRQSISN